MYGRDRRRRPTVEDRRAIFLRAEGRCENCGEALGIDYHNAHLAGWGNGGASAPGNVQAQCVRCNLTNGAEDVEGLSGFQLRPWQADALPVILERLWQSGVATVNAAPGAGKTFFALAVFAALAAKGFVERLIIVSPNLAIIDQWKRSAGKLRIHLDVEPRDGHLEHPDTCGAVISYQVLPRVAELHRKRLDQVPTMVVFDEVHHVGENKSWGDAVREMVGDVAKGVVHPAAVLNMTGTLFRSGRDKQISSVRYDTVLGSDGREKLVAKADWTITTASLIGQELRPPDLYVYSTEAKLMDFHNEKVITGDLGDLDKQQRTVALRGLDKSPEWLRGAASEGIRLLNNQLAVLNNEEPLKVLYCAADIQAAKVAADAINYVTNSDFSRLVHSKDPKAKKKLMAAAAEPRPCAIVQVAMATEGFDCPQVSTIIDMSGVTADLSIMQRMARAMRITDTERANRRLLPAQILIPDNPELREVFARILKDIPRLIDIDDETEPPTPICFLCGQPLPCDCPPGPPPPPPPPRRYELIDLAGAQFQFANVLGHDDGEVGASELNAATSELNGLGIPASYHPRALVFSRRYRPPTPSYADPEPPTGGVVVEEANPRDLNLAYRAKLDQSAKWMAKHIGHDSRFDNAGHFQYLANEVAFIRKGGRDQASPKQLGTCARWMCARIVEHCQEHGEVIPSWARPE